MSAWTGSVRLCSMSSVVETPDARSTSTIYLSFLTYVLNSFSEISPLASISQVLKIASLFFSIWAIFGIGDFETFAIPVITLVIRIVSSSLLRDSDLLKSYSLKINSVFSLMVPSASSAKAHVNSYWSILPSLSRSKYSKIYKSKPVTTYHTCLSIWTWKVLFEGASLNREILRLWVKCLLELCDLVDAEVREPTVVQLGSYDLKSVFDCMWSEFEFY